MLGNIIHLFKMLFSKSYRESLKLENWFVVTWDDEYIYRDVSPPTGNSYQDKFCWADIERIGFEANYPPESDDLYFFTNQRPESYMIPTEAKNGGELWLLVIEKGLFDEALAKKAMASEAGLFFYPEYHEPVDRQ